MNDKATIKMIDFSYFTTYTRLRESISSPFPPGIRSSPVSCNLRAGLGKQILFFLVFTNWAPGTER
jgi:hypothetical protein